MVCVPCTCTIRQQAYRRDHGTEDTFWEQNQFPSTHIRISLVGSTNKSKDLYAYKGLYGIRPSFAERPVEKPARAYRFER